MPVELDVRVGRLPAELEATVYFVCAEALANVAKYASASRARIEVTARDGRLRVVDRRRRRRRRGPPRAAPGCRGSPTGSRRSAATLRVDEPARAAERASPPRSRSAARRGDRGYSASPIRFHVLAAQTCQVRERVRASPA